MGKFKTRRQIQDEFYMKHVYRLYEASVLEQTEQRSKLKQNIAILVVATLISAVCTAAVVSQQSRTAQDIVKILASN